MSHTKAVVATDLVHAHGVPYNSADNFLRVLSEREAAAGKKAMSLIRLRQEIECDATSLGRFFVKPDNIFYADQIQDLQQKKRACLKSYPVHVRVVGAIQRGGLMVVKFMTPKVTLPKARPPVESIREIDRSGLAKYIGADKNTAIYSDGAPSWRTFAKKLKIPVAQVSHQQRQYAVQLRRAPRPKLSKVGGTQCIDAAWGSLKRFMPKQVKRKGKMKGVSCMNATLERRVYQWLWRKNLRADGDVTGQEFLLHLSKACPQHLPSSFDCLGLGRHGTSAELPHLTSLDYLTRRGFKKRDGNGDGKVFHVELLDAEGGEIRASFFNEAAEKFFDLMEVGKCFKLSRGSVRIANRRNFVKRNLTIAVGVLARGEAALPSVEAIILLLLIACLFVLIESSMIPGLEDDSAMSMIVTIWAERAQKEDTVFKGNPVVVMKGVMVKEWQGGRSGSLTEGGLMVMQPDIPEAKAVSAWWQSTGHAQEITFISQTNGLPGPRASGKTMDIMQMKQASEQMVTEQETFSIYCRLAAVQTRKRDEVQPLVYNACMELKDGMNGRTLPCNRRVDENGFCAVCDKKGKAGPRLNLRCRFEDASGNCWLTTFHPAAEKILALSAQEVLVWALYY
ncbi:unnamed protein product [Durusdinium trenchii]|uniref:Replication protein A 70 kDa DNA-binding subunit n=1 Tax=Durusdinium trenchii TaxID=1381693 RepID=A0ABP0LHJ4_9DINO